MDVISRGTKRVFRLERPFPSRTYYEAMSTRWINQNGAGVNDLVKIDSVWALFPFSAFKYCSGYFHSIVIWENLEVTGEQSG